MNLPRTTDLSLKMIAENLDKISSKPGQMGDAMSKPQMTPQMKAQLREMALMFNEYGQAFADEQKIMDSAKAITEFLKLAEMYAVNEGGDVFQENVIKNDFNECSKKAQQLAKLAQETYVRKQQCAVLFDDLLHKVNRYFKVAKPVTANNTPAQA